MKKQNRTTYSGLAILLSAMIILAPGCSTKFMLKTTANVISPFIPETVHSIMAGVDTSYGVGMNATMGASLLVIGFSEVAPNNYTLAWSASQNLVAAAAYNEMFRPDYASELAWQGYRLGMRSLMTCKKFRKAVESGTPVEKAVELLPKKYVEGLTWTSLSLGVWFMMNATDPMAISYAPELNNMVKRACALDGSYFFALPLMLDAVVSAMASEMVQGCGFDRARQSYARMKELNGGKLVLADAYWAQIYAVGTRDRKLYKQLLEGVLNTPDDILDYQGRYMTTMAKGRAKWLLANQEMVFQNMGLVR